MKKCLLFSLIVFPTVFIKADLGRNVLQRYKKNVLVNTGIGSSRNFVEALLAGFSKVHLIEERVLLVEHAGLVLPREIAYHKPRNFKEYKVYHADSRCELSGIIDQISEPITFVLSSYVPEYREYDKENGILLELEQIKAHPLNVHTILIDYIHHAGTYRFGNVTLESIKEKIFEINPQYRFRLETGGHLGKEQNAILVAYLP